MGKTIARKVADTAKLGKAAEEEEDERAAIDAADWGPIVSVMQEELTDVAEDAAKRTLVALGVSDDDSILDQASQDAIDWANDRAAELVGKSWDDEGNLVDNPDAEMAITDSIRDEIRGAVADAIENGESAADLASSIEEMDGFSPERAEMVARTELISASAQGQLHAMRASGVVEKKAWSSAGEDVCDVCQDNEDQGAIGLDDDFDNDGDPCDAPPGHPNCRCALIAVVEDHDEDGDSENEDEDEDE